MPHPIISKISGNVLGISVQNIIDMGGNLKTPRGKLGTHEASPISLVQPQLQSLMPLSVDQTTN